MVNQQVARTHFDASVAATVEDMDSDLAALTGRPRLLHGFEFSNPNAADIFVQLFNGAAADITLGTTTPKLSFVVPGNGANDKMFPTPLDFPAGCSYAATTTATGSTALASNVIVNFWFS